MEEENTGVLDKITFHSPDTYLNSLRPSDAYMRQ